jgi:hypothetical protein
MSETSEQVLDVDPLSIYCEGCHAAPGEPCNDVAIYGIRALDREEPHPIRERFAAALAGARADERERIAIALETRGEFPLAQWVRDEIQRQARIAQRGGTS